VIDRAKEILERLEGQPDPSPEAPKPNRAKAGKPTDDQLSLFTD